MVQASGYLNPQEPQARARLQGILAQGGVVILPTDTVPGLAVLADRPEAASMLAATKGAGEARPYSLHLRHGEELRSLLPYLPPGLPRWLRSKLPGPWTVVLPAEWVALPKAWKWTWPTVGLRLPKEDGYLDFVGDLPAPLLMTSVNPPGEAPLVGRALAEWAAERPAIGLGVNPEAISEAQASTVVAFDPLPQLRRGQRPLHQLQPGLRVLVICTGNICRSPVGAALLERELASAWGVTPADLQELGWVVASAGTYALSGSPASEHSVTAAAEIGLDIRGHRAQHLEEALRHRWDLVLAMGRSHLGAVPASVSSRLFDPFDHEVPDPFGQDLRAYRRMREHLVRACETWIADWSRWDQTQS
ncbi:MAG: hypothetical protein DWQ01_12630 [Planctomycetota bacterium]|nr:MAG: hypothetical protein DWQ01_12630 [Planctomycetota bacterium]